MKGKSIVPFVDKSSPFLGLVYVLLDSAQVDIHPVSDKTQRRSAFYVIFSQVILLITVQFTEIYEIFMKKCCIINVFSVN